jgi:hypothetical protein
LAMVTLYILVESFPFVNVLIAFLRCHQHS